ncbi:MAG: phage portal protein, partial [Bacteroidales bacterium]|nr:phage portal protein [Bacteroidales bacterium]
ELLLRKKPFTRGADNDSDETHDGETIGINGTIIARLPKYKRRIVSQERFMRELDPNCHDCLFDENIPSICVKIADNDFRDIKYTRTAIPFQKIIRNKQVLHLTGNPMVFTLSEQNPTDEQMESFIKFKDAWEERNQDGMKKLFAEKQLSLGDAGMLYYFDQDGCIKSRVIGFDDGYVILPHNDENGDRVCEAVYYMSGEDEYIDMYDKTNHYRFTNRVDDVVVVKEGSEDITEKKSTWKLVEGFPQKHGFDEIPLITKRGDVAWNDVQTLIDNYEVLYNVFNAIQKRFGWGLLYVKGRFNENARKIAGSVVLNDTSIEGKGDAKFLTPPSPENTIMTLEKIEDNIKIGSSTTFILPKDVKTSGDISGIAIQLTQSLDIEKGEQLAKSYQNVANKMVRLFKQGLAIELVNKEEDEHAITKFDRLKIHAKFKVWRPFSATEYNQMLVTLKAAGLISEKTGIEKNTESTPDEVARVSKQKEEQEQKDAEKMVNEAKIKQQYGSSNTEKNNKNEQ